MHPKGSPRDRVLLKSSPAAADAVAHVAPAAVVAVTAIAVWWNLNITRAVILSLQVRRYEHAYEYEYGSFCDNASSMTSSGRRRSVAAAFRQTVGTIQRRASAFPFI